MKPDWDTLADEYEGSKTVLIADVDCTADGKDLCTKYEVSGYPTIKTFGPGDATGTSYDGGRSLEDLRKHAATLGPSCSIDRKELCSQGDLADLEKYAAMSEARRTAKITKIQNAIKKEETRHEGVLKTLNMKYEASNKAIEDLKAELSPQIRLLTMATPKAKDATEAA